MRPGNLCVRLESMRLQARVLVLSMFAGVVGGSAAVADPVPTPAPPGGVSTATPLPITAAAVPSLNSALRALHGGNPERAAADLVRIRTAGGIGEPAEGHYLVGRAWLEAGKPQYAVLPLRQAARSYTALQDYALFHLGEAYLQLGRGSAAVEAFERLLVDYPDSVLVVKARLRLADSLAADSQWERAIETYTNVMEAGGSGIARQDLMERIALAKEKAGDKPGAVDIWIKIWRDHPASAAARTAATRMDALAAAGVPVPSRTSTAVRYWRALAMSEAGKPGEALAELDKLIAAKAKLPADWRTRRSLVLFRKRDYTAARAALEKAVPLTPAGASRAEAMYWLGRSQARLSDYAASNATYVKLRKQYPDSKWAREALFKQGLMALEEKNLTASASYFDAYAKQYPNASDADEAVWYTGWSQFRARKYVAAEATLKRLMSRYPRSSLVQRGMYWTGRGQILSGRKDVGLQTLAALSQEDSLTYYGLLAAGALAENGFEPPPPTSETPISSEEALDPAVEVAGTDAPSGSALPSAPEDPSDEIETAAPPAMYRFHVSRAQALVRLGFQQEAALELTAARKAASSRVHKLELARLALDAEYFHGAMNIARTSFGDELDSSDPTSEVYRLAYPKAYPRFVTSYADQYKYKPAMLWAIMREESTFRPEVVSPVGAIGLLQIMPYTGQEIADGLGVKGFTAERLYDPEINIGFSAWYVRKLLSKYGGNEALAIGSYNAGPDAMDRWLKARGDLALDEFVEEIPYTETRRYVKRVLMSYGIYEALYGEGPPRIRGARTVERASLVGGDKDASAIAPPAPATNPSATP